MLYTSGLRSYSYFQQAVDNSRCIKVQCFSNDIFLIFILYTHYAYMYNIPIKKYLLYIYIISSIFFLYNSTDSDITSL